MTSTFSDLKSRTRSYYEESLARYGDDPRGVNWRDRDSQALRFRLLAEMGGWQGRSVHDIGCGLAHLHDYLAEQGLGCDYLGTDISPAMIDTARARLGDRARLAVADVLKDGVRPDLQADFVVNSGIFTVRGDNDRAEWQSFVEAMVERMFQLSRVGIAFNMMTSYVDYQDAHLFYHPPQDMMDFCIRKLSRKVAIRHDYPLWEYTVHVWR